MRLERCSGVGLRHPRVTKTPPKRGVSIEKGVPSRGETDVGVTVTIVPVVDVQPISIEVTDVDTVAVRIEKFAHLHLCH